MEKTRDFIMEIEEVGYITNRGIFAQGKILNGIVRLGDCLEIIENSIIAKTFIASIERIEKNSNKGITMLLVSKAQAGDTVRLLLTNSRSDDIRVGQIISTPRKSNLNN